MSQLAEFRNFLISQNYTPAEELRICSTSWMRLAFGDEKPVAASGGCKIIENPDGSIYANFGSQKDAAGFRTWTSGKAAEKTYEQMAMEKIARKSHLEFLEKKEKERFAVIGKRLSRIIERLPLAENHPYLSDKCIKSHGIKIRPKTGELIIPRFGFDGEIYSLQRIKQKKLGEKNWKGYFKGACGKELFYLISDDYSDFSTIAIAEGFATGASVYESTGIPTYICFDAGQMMSVAIGVKKLHPKSRIVIAADNDQWSFASGKMPKGIDKNEIDGDDSRWSEWRSAGLLNNTGVTKANAAAAKIGGALVIIPDIADNHPKKITDFNDLMLEKGKEHVKNLFESILEIPQVKTVEEADEGRIKVQSVDVQAPLVGDFSLPFRVLGYNGGTYYYYPFGEKRIVALTPAGHNMLNFFQLADEETWLRPYRGDNGKLLENRNTIASSMASRMMTLAMERGVFMEEDSVRGVGAWIDEGRVVLHCGTELYVDGEKTHFNKIESDFTYIAAVKLLRLSQNPLNNLEAHQLRKICESVSWEKKLSGTLLSGWMVIAPICSALQFRPHIFVTGEAESGKSTILNRIIKPVLGKMALCVDGGTTEPAIRTSMGYDARPLVYDEAEPSVIMGSVIELLRKASTGSVVKKFGQQPFKARFCACLSAINPAINKTADESRVVFMKIKKNTRATAMQEYEDLLTRIEEVITPDFSERLLARTLQNMNSLIANIRIFQKAFRLCNPKSARASELIGTLLAGVYMLGRTDIITIEKAQEFIQQHDWSTHTNLSEESDPMRLVQHLLSSFIRTHRDGDITVGELIMQVRGRDIEVAKRADKLLKNYGIKVLDTQVSIISRSQNLEKLLKGTEWSIRWNNVLSDIVGAEKRSADYFTSRTKSSAVRLPIELFLDEEPQDEMQF